MINRIIKTKIEGVFIVKYQKYIDKRGFFSELFREKEFKKYLKIDLYKTI